MVFGEVMKHGEANESGCFDAGERVFQRAYQSFVCGYEINSKDEFFV
jgi:hypothetical protein